MMPDLTFLALPAALAVVAAVVLLFTRKRWASRTSNGPRTSTIPGPRPVNERDGNLPDIKAAGSLHEFLERCHSQYGPVVSLSLGPTSCVSIASPGLFAEQAKVFDRPVELSQSFMPLIGPESIQFANGPLARRRHAAYARCYSDEALRKGFPLLTKIASEFVRELTALPADDHIAVRPRMFQFAITAMLQFSYGTYFKGKAAIDNIRESYDYTWDYLTNAFTDGTNAESPQKKEIFQKHKARLLETMSEVVRGRAEAPPSPGDELFVDTLLGLGLSDDSVLSDAVTFLIGSFHNTGLLLTWCLYYLADNSGVRHKVTRELDDVLGDGPVTPDNFGQLKYLRQVLQETLRCCNLAPVAARVQDCDVTLGGHKVTAGTPVILALGVVAHDKDIYSEPDRFDPDRFAPNQDRTRPSFSFEPFGFAGKRKCPGCKLAYLEATIFLSVLLRELDFELVPGQKVTRDYGFVTKPRDELWMTVRPRCGHQA